MAWLTRNWKHQGALCKNTSFKKAENHVRNYVQTQFCLHIFIIDPVKVFSIQPIVQKKKETEIFFSEELAQIITAG